MGAVNSPAGKAAGLLRYFANSPGLEPLRRASVRVFNRETASPGRFYGQGQIPLERPAAGTASNQARDPRLGRQARASRGWLPRTGVALRSVFGRRAIRDRIILPL